MDCNRLLLWREPVFNFENKKFIFHTQKRKTINQPVLTVAFKLSPISIPFPVYISTIFLLQKKSHLEIFGRSWKIPFFRRQWCWWLYDGDRFKMSVTESLCCRLFSLCWWFFNALDRSPTYLIGHQYLKLVTNIFRLQHPLETSMQPNIFQQSNWMSMSRLIKSKNVFMQSNLAKMNLSKSEYKINQKWFTNLKPW